MALGKLECRTGEFEQNVQLVTAALAGTCCDRHGCEAALVAIRAGMVNAMVQRKGSVDMGEVERLRDRYKHLFSKSSDSSGLAAIALLDLLVMVFSCGVEEAPSTGYA